MGQSRQVRIDGEHLDNLDQLRPAIEKRAGVPLTDGQLRDLMARRGVEALRADYHAELVELQRAAGPG